MEDFEQISKGSEQRGISIIMDMVLNYTSTEYEWFQKTLAGDEKYYRILYILKA